MDTNQRILQRILNEYRFNDKPNERLWLDTDEQYRDEDNLKVTMTSNGYLAYHKLTTLLYELNEITDCLPQINDIIYALDFIVNEE